MRYFITSLSCVFGLALLVACEGKPAAPRNTHDAGGQTVAELELARAKGTGQIAAYDLAGAKSLLTASAMVQYKQIYQPLTKLIFSTATIEDPVNSHDLKLKDLFYVMNRAILNILNSTEVSEDLKAELTAKYSQEVFKNCVEEYETCSRIAFFQNDPQTSDILMHEGEALGGRLESRLARLDVSGTTKGSACAKSPECGQELRLYYKHFLMAFHLRNQTVNERLSLGYVRFSALYGDFFVAQSQASKAEYDFQKHRLVFQLSFSQLKMDASNLILNSILNSQSSFLYSQSKGSPFDAETFLKSVQLYLYICPGSSRSRPMSDCPKSSRVLNPEFQGALREITRRRTRTTPSAGSKYFQLRDLDSLSYGDIADFVNGTQSVMLSNLNTDTVFAEDEYFYLVNAILSGDLSATQADQFWRATKQDFGKFRAALDKYVNMYMIYMIGQTNMFMNSVYSQRGTYASNELVQEAIDQSKTAQDQWVKLNHRVNLLGQFVRGSLQDFSGFEPLDVKLNAFTKSIKYTSVYPNMMMMMYYLSDVNFEFTIRGPFSNQKINAAKMVRDLFSGMGGLWLYFGNDEYTLNDFEILYTVYYALKTEVFSAFGNIPDISASDESKPKNVDEYQYFNLVLSSLYDTEFQDLVNGINAVRTQAMHNDKLSTFMDICSDLRDPVNDKKGGVGFAPVTTRAHVGRVGTFPEYYDQMDFRDVFKYTFLEDLFKLHEGTAITPLHAAVELYDESYGGYMRRLNFELVPQLERAESMLEILRDHFRKRVERETDPKKRAELIGDYREKLQKIERIVGKARNNISAFVSFWVNTHSQLENCVDMVGEVSRARALALYEQEKSHLTRIHGWMGLLQSQTANGEWLGSMPFSSARSAVQSLIATAVNGAVSAQYGRWLVALDELSTKTDYYAMNDDGVKNVYQLMNERLKAIANHPKVPTLNRSGQYLYSGFDEIQWSPGKTPRYTYSLIDAMFRQLDYYKDGIAPNVYSNIQMPGDLTKDVVDYRLVAPMPFTGSLESFIRQARSQIGGVDSDKMFVRYWKSNVNFTIQKGRSDILRNLYYVGEFDLYPNWCADQMTSYLSKDNRQTAVAVNGQAESAVQTAEKSELESRLSRISPECSKKRQRVRVTADDLIQNQVEKLNALDLRPGEQRMLREMNNSQGLYALSDLGDIVVDRGNYNLQTTYFQDGLAKIFEMTTRVFNRSQFYFDAQRNVGELSFPIDTSVQKTIKCRYYTQTHRAIDLANDYRAKVLARQAQDVKNRTVPVVHYGFDGTEILTASSTVDGRFAYLPLDKVKDLKTNIDKFHENTLGFFNKDAKPSAETGNSEVSGFFPTPEECAMLKRVDWD